MTALHSKSESFRIFDSIARRYDFINSVLSFGMHAMWRRRLRQYLPNKKAIRALDLATGTGDVALTLIQDARVKEVVGLDMSEGMLAIARDKIHELGYAKRISLVHGNAETLPFAAETYDLVTISFGIRNVADVVTCLREGHRVLTSGGRFLVLEFGLPKQSLLRAGHLFYLRHVLPLIGKVLSGHSYAYKYLNETIEEFPYGEKFVDLMHQAGFAKAGYETMTFGSVHLYWGEKT